MSKLEVNNIYETSFPLGIEDAELVKMLGLGDKYRLEGITFKAPQILAIEHILGAQCDILSLDKGMGKTIVYLAAMHFAGIKKFLILCSNNAKLTQAVHLTKYFPHLRYVFVEHQQKAKRQKMWEGDYDVFIATPATFLADMGRRATSSGQVIPSDIVHLPMIIDEYHKNLRSRKSNLFKTLKDIQPPYLILSSGSAGGKGPQDMWAALNVCNRKRFSSFWRYVERYTEVEMNRWGRTISGVQNIEEWRKVVASNCFHRKKDLKDYPPKTRTALPVQMEPWQKRLHDQLRNELWAVWKDEQTGLEKMVITPNILQATMKLRQFMICPKILDESFGYGAGLEAIWEDVDDSELSHWVISTPFRAGIPYISQFFVDRGKVGTVFQGGEYANADGLQSAIARWTARGGAAIQTIDFAESYELPAARIMYMLGYKHSSKQNEQAEDRIHRDIRVTPYPVDIYYVKHLESYDSQLIDMMSEGADIEYALMSKPLTEVFR